MKIRTRNVRSLNGGEFSARGFNKLHREKNRTVAWMPWKKKRVAPRGNRVASCSGERFGAGGANYLRGARRNRHVESPRVWKSRGARGSRDRTRPFLFPRFSRSPYRIKITKERDGAGARGWKDRQDTRWSPVSSRWRLAVSSNNLLPFRESAARPVSPLAASERASDGGGWGRGAGGRSLFLLAAFIGEKGAQKNAERARKKRGVE